MKITPGKDVQAWAAFNSRFGALLNVTPTICFWLVVVGSVYGIQKSIEAQHPEVGIIIAVMVAWLVQKMNSVSVHFSTRFLALCYFWVFNKSALRNNRYQKGGGIDVFVGLFCIAFTFSICYFDFRANKEGSEKAADSVVQKPEEQKVDTSAHAAAIGMATLSVNAAKAAENAERRVFEAQIDSEINKRRSALSKRKSNLLAVKSDWAINEMKAIDRELLGLENIRRNRKKEFIPTKSNVAGAQTELAAISSQNSRMLLEKQLQADSTNTATSGHYEAKKEGFSMAMFGLYLAAMLLWHLCHFMLMYRALRFDEQHPDNESPLVAIAETVKDGVANLLWMGKAKIMGWMPEDEIHGITRTDLLAATDTQICADVYGLILENQGINEMLIYTSLRGTYEPDDVRQALRLLKTSKLVFEHSHTWTADENQSGFFLPTTQ